MRIQKILCPTDLSLNSANGIAYAYSLAVEYRADLVVFHVTRFPSVPPAALGASDLLPLDQRSYAPPPVDLILRRARARLNAFINPLLSSRCQTRVALGKPAEEIIAMALDERVDLIVIAKRQMGQVRRLFSSSLSERLSRKAPCPVLSICPPKIQRPHLTKPRPAASGVLAQAQG
jgi:nucleotide-binding universal stress UspA family protein